MAGYENAQLELIRYLLLCIPVLWGNISFAQCISRDVTVTVPDAGSYSANVGETICITGTGSFISTISLNTDGATPVLCIGSDVVFTSGFLNTNTNDYNDEDCCYIIFFY